MEQTLDDIILAALEEDIPTIDVTTDYLFRNEQVEAVAVAKESGVISGTTVFERVFYLMDHNIKIKWLCHDGDMVENQDIIAVISGSAKSILKAERVALNLFQHLCGIATMTKSFVDEVVGTTKILDTRKTTPLYRALEKRAVLDGGGTNHRFSLSDQVMIKDNHIAAAGSIKNAVQMIKSQIPNDMKIEVEVTDFDQFKEALETDCDIIMLDNMSNEQMRNCVINNHEKKLLEASGNMTKERIRSVCETGVDFISVGALTHSVRSLDISLKINF
jgi:nicotinate-nucleotide pyrophosphorylase (carboxylating)